jgi:hypothetical protein
MGKIFNAVFPMIESYKANKLLYKKLNPKNETGEYTEPIGILDNVDNADGISLESLKELYSETLKGKDKLEDKAKANIIGVTISISLIMGASAVLSTLNEKFPFSFFSWILFTLFVLTVAYMLVAGLLVIRLLIGENEIYVVKLNSLASGEAEIRKDYDKCISLNQEHNSQ